LISDYQNEKDLNGYLYTVVNPETRGSNFYAGTKLFFHDVPEDILFVDCNPGFNNEINDQRETAEMHYASGETVYFFVDRDLIVTSISNEFERKDGVGCIGYIGNGVVLEPAKITKSPIKLIDYINLYKNDDLYGSYDGPYKQELRSYFYTRFDEAMTFPYNANLEAEMRLARETFQLMAVEFEASLEAQTNTVIELSFLSPVFFDYGDHYRKINVMEFEPNPADRWKQIEDIEFTVLTGDKIFETALPFVEVDNGYRLKLIEEPSQAISISIDNSSDGSNRFGCGCASVTVYNVMWAMAVLMISALILRKR
jgi:hypothetical protein